MRVSLGLGQEQGIFLCTTKKRASNRVRHSNKILTSFNRYQKTSSRANGKKRIDLMDESKDSKSGLTVMMHGEKKTAATRVDELRVVFLSTEVSPWYVML